MITAVAQEALYMLEGKGEILETARRVTQVMRDAGVEGGVVGGVAVFLHGYERSTLDVDVYVEDSAALKQALEDAGFYWSDEKREFYYADGVVPVQVLTDVVVIPPQGYSEIDGIRVIRLADLLTMKIDSGTREYKRTKDIADVIELIQRIGLDGRMTAKLHPSVRDEYKTILRKLK